MWGAILFFRGWGLWQKAVLKKRHLWSTERKCGKKKASTKKLRKSGCLYPGYRLMSWKRSLLPKTINSGLTRVWFWGHAESPEKDIKKKKFKAGGSTISQQLAKNLYLSPSKNPIRKVKEAILTWRMERNLSKRRIMELYLNLAEWGDGVFGIEAAAETFREKRRRPGTPGSGSSGSDSAQSHPI